MTMDLQDYLQDLEAADQLATVDAAVQCDLELAALCRREFVKPAGGKALLFGKLVESEFRVAANLFGSEERLARLFGCRSMEQYSDKISDFLLKRQSSELHLSFQGAISRYLALGQTQLQIISEADASGLPAIRSWPGELRPYLTLALTITNHPETGELNVGLYRAQLLSATELAINFAAGSGADLHLLAAKKMQKSLPIALVLGADPVFLWAAAAPFPETVNEFKVCSELFGSSSEFIHCVSQKLSVPAQAEVVIEGIINPNKRCVEGPFGNHTGQYVTRKDCPMMKVTAVLQKPAPIIPMTVVGPPPSENINLGKANEILIREMLKRDFPQIVNLHMPVETVFHGVSLISVRSQNNKLNRELIEQLWLEGPLRKAKFILLLDEDIDLGCFSKCWWRAINRLSASRTYQHNDQFAIDATGVDLGSLVEENQEIKDLLEKRSREYNL